MTHMLQKSTCPASSKIPRKMAHASQCRPQHSNALFTYVTTRPDTHTHRSRLFIFIPCYIFFFVFEGGKNHSTNADCAIWIALAVSRDTTDAIRDLTQRYYFKWKLRTGKNRSISSDLQVGATKCVVCFKMPAQPPVCWILISQSFKCTYRMWRMRQIRP